MMPRMITARLSSGYKAVLLSDSTAHLSSRAVHLSYQPRRNYRSASLSAQHSAPELQGT